MPAMGLLKKIAQEYRKGNETLLVDAIRFDELNTLAVPRSC